MAVKLSFYGHTPLYLHALWQYGFKQYEEVLVWHTIPYCPAFWTVFDNTSSTALISIYLICLEGYN